MKLNSTTASFGASNNASNAHSPIQQNPLAKKNVLLGKDVFFGNETVVAQAKNHFWMLKPSKPTGISNYRFKPVVGSNPPPKKPNGRVVNGHYIEKERKVAPSAINKKLVEIAQNFMNTMQKTQHS